MKLLTPRVKVFLRDVLPTDGTALTEECLSHLGVDRDRLATPRAVEDVLREYSHAPQ